MSKCLASVVCLCLFSGASAQAATPTLEEIGQLLAPDGAAADYFGHSVAVDGDTAVVGAYGDDDLGNESGAAYVFTRDGSGAWSMQQKLLPDDGGADDRFGWVVAVDGDIAVIGRESWDFFDPPAGAAWVFVRDSSGVWTQRQKLTAFDGAPGDYFGESVALSGDTIAVGARGDDDMGTNSGSVYVYTADAAGQWTLQQKLTAAHGMEGDLFGNQLDLDGDTAVIAASGYDASGTITDSGAVHLFTRDATGRWTEQQRLLPEDPASNSAFATSVALDGDSLAVGAWGDDQLEPNAGAVYMYGRDAGGLWSQRQKLYASDRAAGGYFGTAVDIDGDHLVVGAYGDDHGGTDAGAAYLYARDGSGLWGEQVKLIASDGQAYDYLAGAATAVTLSGTTAIAGALLDDTGAGDNAGSAYVFELLPSADGADVTVSPSTVDFGDALIGQAVVKSVTVSNYGTADLALLDIGITSGIDFSQSNDCPPTLPPGAACQVTVTFVPTQTGALADTLTVSSDDPDEASVEVNLSGEGIAALPDLVVSAIAAPDVLIVGDYATITATVANPGGADVAGGYYVHIYLDDSPLGLDWISDAPAAGSSVDVSWFVKVPRVPKGSHELRAVVDSGDDIAESDEQNNSFTRSVTVQPN